MSSTSTSCGGRAPGVPWHPSRAYSPRRARWVVNEAVSAPMLVGAGGHFCPVARTLGAAPGVRPSCPRRRRSSRSSCARLVRRGRRHARDLLQPGLRGLRLVLPEGAPSQRRFRALRRPALPAARDEFCPFSRPRAGFLPAPCGRGADTRTLAPGRRPVTVGDGVMLVGDAAGLAYPQSGEGIRPAVESGLLAASAIVGAGGDTRATTSSRSTGASRNGSVKGARPAARARDAGTCSRRPGARASDWTRLVVRATRAARPVVPPPHDALARAAPGARGSPRLTEIR